MTTPGEALQRLDGHALELDRLSNALAQVQRELEAVEIQYNEFVDEFEIGLYLQSEAEDGPKLPAQAMQRRLARRAMAPELLGRYDGLLRKRERIRQRISDLGKLCDTERTILVALRESP